MNREIIVHRSSTAISVETEQGIESFEGTAADWFSKAIFALCFFQELALFYHQQLDPLDPHRLSPDYLKRLLGLSRRNSRAVIREMAQLNFIIKGHHSEDLLNKLRRSSEFNNDYNTIVNPGGIFWYIQAKQRLDTYYKNCDTNSPVQLPEDFPKLNINTSTIQTKDIQLLWIIMTGGSFSAKTLRQAGFEDPKGFCNRLSPLIEQTTEGISLSEKGQQIAEHLLRPLWEEAKRQRPTGEWFQITIE